MRTAESIAQQRYSYSQSSSKRTSIAIEGMTVREQDEILDQYPKLISPQFRGWFIKRLKVLGRRKFIEYADRAMKYGDEPQKLFVHLIKEM